MTDLTEQWKKRTLPNGVYYIKLIGGDILPAFCNTEYVLKQFQTMKGIYDGVDIEVLAPVPSYEEFQNLKEYEQTILSYNMKPIDYEIACETVNKLLDERKALKEENAQLKELLRECKEVMSTGGYIFATVKQVKRARKLLENIDEVLK